MTSFFRTLPDPDAPPAGLQPARADPWRLAVGVLAGVLVLGGIIAAVVGLRGLGGFEGTGFGDDPRYDGAVITAFVGGLAIVLGVVVGTCWLVLGSLARMRRP